MEQLERKAEFWAKFEEQIDSISTEEEIRDLLNEFIDVYVRPKFPNFELKEIPIYFDEIKQIYEHAETGMFFSDKRLNEKGKRYDELQDRIFDYAQRYNIDFFNLLKEKTISKEDQEDIKKILIEINELKKEVLYNEQDCICVNNGLSYDVINKTGIQRKLAMFVMFSNIIHEYRHYAQYLASKQDRYTLISSGKAAQSAMEYKHLLGDYSKRAVKTIMDEREQFSERSFYVLKDFVTNHQDVFGEDYKIRNFNNEEKLTELGFFVSYGSYISKEHEVDARMFAIDVMDEVNKDLSKFNKDLSYYADNILSELDGIEDHNREYSEVFYRVIRQTVAMLMSDEKFFDVLQGYDNDLERLSFTGNYSEEYQVKQDLLREILGTMYKVVMRDERADGKTDREVKRELEKFKYVMFEEFVAHGIIFASHIMKKEYESKMQDPFANNVYVSVLKKRLQKGYPLTEKSFYDIKNVLPQDKAELFKLCIKNDQMIYAQNIGTSFYGGFVKQEHLRNEFLEDVLPAMEEKVEQYKKRFDQKVIIFDDIDAYLSLIEDMSIVYNFKLEREKGKEATISKSILDRFEKIDNDLENLGLEYVNNLRRSQGLKVLDKDECFYYRKGRRVDRQDYLSTGKDREKYIGKKYGPLFKE